MNSSDPLTSQIGKSVGQVDEDGRKIMIKHTPYEWPDRSFPKPDRLVLRKPPSSKTSIWWGVYHLDERNSCHAYCNYCGRLVVCNLSSTSGLIFHLKNFHPAEHGLLSSAIKSKGSDGMAQTTLHSIVRTNTKIDDATKREMLLEKICRYIIINMKPLSVVENEEFRDFCRLLGEDYYEDKALQPIFTVENVSDWITAKAAEVRGKIAEMTKGQVVSLTTDHWSSLRKDSYCALTCHWIDKDFVIHSVDLGCWFHEGRSTSAALLEDFKTKVFSKAGFHPTTRIFATTTDTTANMNKFGTQLYKDVEIHHIYCHAHVIQLTVKKVYGGKSKTKSQSSGVNSEQNDASDTEDEQSINSDNELARQPEGQLDLPVISKLRKLVIHINKANQKLAELMELQNSLKKPDEIAVTPISDVPTRWSSTNAMLERAIRLKECINIMQGRGKFPEGLHLTEPDWDLLSNIHDLLAPFAAVQKELEGEKYPTSSKVVQLILQLKETDLEVVKTALAEKESEDVAQKIAGSLQEDLDTRFGASNEPIYGKAVRYDGPSLRQKGFHPTLCIASMLDPGLKLLKWLHRTDLVDDTVDTRPGEKFSFRKALKDEMEKAIVQNLFGVADHISGEKPSDDEVPMPPRSPSQQPLQKDDCSVDTYGSHDPNLVNGIDLEAEVNKEFLLYMKDKSYEKGTDILLWWRKKREKYKILSRLARVYLAIPATSASSERVFSKAGRVIAKDRTRLGTEKASDLIWLASILQREVAPEREALEKKREEARKKKQEKEVEKKRKAEELTTHAEAKKSKE